MQNDLKSASHGRHFLRRSDAATYITERYGFPCSRQWLAKLAVIGGGPVFRKAGRYPVYEPNELDRGLKHASGRPSGRLRKSIRRDLMGARHPNPRLIKIHRNYSVEDIARLFGIHKNTVRNWLKQGLAAMDDRQPLLILGRELLRFLQERRQRAKQSCGPGRIYCIACRAPKVPAGKMADCIPTGHRSGNLRGICPDCDRLIYRRVNLAKIDAVRGDLEITFTGPCPRLGESAGPSVNCDSGEKAQTHENA